MNGLGRAWIKPPGQARGNFLNLRSPELFRQVNSAAKSLKVTDAVQSTKEKRCRELRAIAFQFFILGCFFWGGARRSFSERSFSFINPIRNVQFLCTPTGSYNRGNDSVISHIPLTSHKWVLAPSGGLCVKFE